MGKTNIDRVAETQEELENGSSEYGAGKIPLIKWVEGTHRLRILPPPGDMQEPWLKLKVCFKVGPNKKVIIPRRQYGLEPCPMSERLDRIAKKTDKASVAELKATKPGTRFKFFVIDRDNEEAGPQLADFNVVAHKDLVAFYMDPEFGALDDPDEGRDIKVRYIPKEKTKGKTFPEFGITPGAKVTPLKPAAMSDEDYAAMLEENYFTKYKVGFPHVPEYVEAVFRGEEKEFKGHWSTNPDGTPLADRDEDADDDTPAKGDASEDPPITTDEDDDAGVEPQDVDDTVQKHAAAPTKPVSGKSVREMIQAKLNAAKK